MNSPSADGAYQEVEDVEPEWLREAANVLEAPPPPPPPPPPRAGRVYERDDVVFYRMSDGRMEMAQVLSLHVNLYGSPSPPPLWFTFTVTMTVG